MKTYLKEEILVREATRIHDYSESEVELSLWRKEKWEVDLLVTKRGKFQFAFELKSGRHPESTKSMQAFRKLYPKVPLYMVSADEKLPRKTSDGFEVLPVLQAIKLMEESF